MDRDLLEDVVRMDAALKQRIDAYLEGAISVHDLRGWIVAQDWSLLRTKGDESLLLLGRLGSTRARIGEFDDGAIDARQLKEALRYHCAFIEGRHMEAPEWLAARSKGRVPQHRTWRL